MATQKSLRLNQSMRQAFVSAVMDDLPSIDYTQQAQEMVQEWLYNAAPVALREAYINPKTKDYFHPDYQHLYNTGLGGFTVQMTPSHQWRMEQDAPRLYAMVVELGVKARAQSKARDEMKAKLTGVIYAYNTVKQAREGLPEFVKYLPDDSLPVDRTVPAIANLVSDLMAAGWPKDEVKVVTKAKRKTKIVI